MVDRFVKNTTLPFEEGLECEFKDITRAIDKVRSITGEVDKYVVGYLNKGKEGSIYWGISDNGIIHGVLLNKAQRDAIRRGVPEKLRTIQPTTTPTEYQEPSLTSVYDNENDTLPIAGLYIVKVVAPRAFCLAGLHYTADGNAFLRNGTSTARLNVHEIESELKKRVEKANQMEDPKPVPVPPTPTPINITVNVLPNPYGIAATATSEMFKGRNNEIQKLLSAIRNGNHRSIHGLQRVGKTSLVQETLRGKINHDCDLRDKILFTKVDLQQQGGRNLTYGNLLNAIIRGIADEIPGSNLVNIEGLLDRSYRHSDLQRMLADYTRILEDIAKLGFRRDVKGADSENRIIVLFLDEFSELYRAINTPGRQISSHTNAQDINADVQLLQWLSSLMRNENLTRRLVFILAVRPFVIQYDNHPDLQLLRLARPINLSYLDKDAAIKLMTEPVAGAIDYEEDAIDYLHHLTTGHPYLIQLILSEIIERIEGENRNCITKKDIIIEEENLITDMTAESHFNVLDSDYSMDAVTTRQYRDFGKGVLALIARKGDKRLEGWVEVENLRIAPELRDVEENKIDTLLAQLRDAKIIDERGKDDGNLEFRMSIPLLQKRYIKQNMYGRYFRKDSRGVHTKKF